MYESTFVLQLNFSIHSAHTHTVWTASYWYNIEKSIKIHNKSI